MEPLPKASEAGATTAVASFRVHLAELHQIIDGFGVSCAWTAQDLPDDLADLLFCPSAGIGLSLCRSRVGPNDEASTDLTCWEQSTMRKARERGARLWSTPWTPPAPWKDNGSKTHGGVLQEGCYAEYAERLARCVADLQSRNLPLEAISIQNEPDLATGYESCQWTGQQIHNFLPLLHRALKRHGTGATRILLPEESKWRIGLVTESLADPLTAPLVGMVAAHGYGLRARPLDTRGKRLWQTEVADLGNPFDPSMADALRWAENLHDFLTLAEVNAWHWWWVYPREDDNSGLLARDGRRPKRLFAIGQYSRFVRPGWRRASCAGSGPVKLSAFLDPAAGCFAVVAVNNSALALDLRVELAGMPAGTKAVTPWVTSAELSLAPQADRPVSDRTFCFTLPAQSVVSFVSTEAQAGTAEK